VKRRLARNPAGPSDNSHHGRVKIVITERLITSGAVETQTVNKAASVLAWCNLACSRPGLTHIVAERHWLVNAISPTSGSAIGATLHPYDMLPATSASSLTISPF